MRKTPVYSFEARQKISEGGKKSQETRRRYYDALREEYLLNPIICLREGCENPISFLERKVKRYCSRSCAVTVNNSTPKRKRTKWAYEFCAWCQTPLKARQKFCCRDCYLASRRENNLLSWKEGRLSGDDSNGLVKGFVREYLYEMRGEACELCGWAEINLFTGRIPLQIHHLLGASFEREEELQILCPSCHALTGNYGVYGHGRPQRYASKAKEDEALPR